MAGNHASKLRIVGTRLCVGVAIGLVAGGLMIFAQILSGDIHPLDRWRALRVYEIIGAISGTIIGVAWGVVATVAGDPPSVNPPPPTPEATSESNRPPAD